MTTKPNIITHVRERVLANPDGIIRSFEREGRHREDSYLDLWTRSGAIASMIGQSGIRPGSPIVIAAEKANDFLPAFWACLRADTIAVPLTGLAREAMAGRSGGLDEALNKLGSPCIILDRAMRGMADRESFKNRKVIVIDEWDSVDGWTDVTTGTTDLACVLPTSGSTGTVKLAKLTHAALVRRYLWRSALSPHALGVFPLDSVTGHHAVYLRHQSWTQIPRDVLVRNPTAILDAIETAGASSVNLSTSIINRLLTENARKPRQRNLSCVEYLGMGGEPISPRTARDFLALVERYGACAPGLRTAYGTTETGPLVTGSIIDASGDQDGFACLGAPRPHVQMKIVDDGGDVLAEGAIGELYVKCPEVMFSGYWGEPLETSPSLTADGWWRTGDLGRLRDGKLSLHGRTKHVLIVSGRKFALGDIDHVIQSVLHQGESAFSCILARDGSAHERLGVGFLTDAPASRAETVARSINEAIQGRFGLSAEKIIRVDQFPLTTGGKLDRRQLATEILKHTESNDVRRSGASSFPSSPNADYSVDAVWCRALGITAPADPDANFFDLGGDSLRALVLHIELVDGLGIRIESDDFFTNPTLRHLKHLIDRQPIAAPQSSGNQANPLRWPLPDDLRGPLMAALAGWPGKRVTRSRMLLGNQIDGSRPPIFWVLNTRPETEWLIAALGDQQPLYVFRSGADIFSNDEDSIQAFALRYISDMEEILPNGPFIIAGHCQGGRIALAMAQHALRRGHHVPLLVLSDWTFPPQSYSGQVLLISGHRNSQTNAYRHFAIPAIAWRRAFARFESIELEGSFALDSPGLGAFGAAIRDRIDAAMGAPTDFLPSRSRQASISAHVPRFMVLDRRCRIIASVTNESDQTWLGTHRSGLTVGCRWIDRDGDVVEANTFAAPLPDLQPRSSTNVVIACRTPTSSGEYLFHIDICEQGRRWFHMPGTEGFCTPVRVGQGKVVSLARRINRIVKRKQFDSDALHYAFDFKSDTLDLLVSGWSSPEAWGTWSDSERAKLRLPLATIRGRWRAIVRCQGFGIPGSTVTLRVQAGARAEIAWTMPATSITDHSFELDAGGEDLVITFLTPGQLSPRELGIGEDKRRLGVGLVSVRLKRL